MIVTGVMMMMGLRVKYQLLSSIDAACTAVNSDSLLHFGISAMQLPCNVRTDKSQFPHFVSHRGRKKCCC